MEIRLMYGPDISQRFIDVLATLKPVDLTLDEARDVFRYRFRNGVKTAVAIEDGQIVGTATLLLEKKFIHKGAMAGHIEDVAVHPDFQKRGVGKALIAFLVELAENLITPGLNHTILWMRTVGPAAAPTLPASTCSTWPIPRAWSTSPTGPRSCLA